MSILAAIPAFNEGPTIDKEVDVNVLKAQNKPTYAQVTDKSIVDEAIKRNGGVWSGDPRWY